MTRRDLAQQALEEAFKNCLNGVFQVLQVGILVKDEKATGDAKNGVDATIKMYNIGKEIIQGIEDDK